MFKIINILIYISISLLFVGCNNKEYLPSEFKEEQVASQLPYWITSNVHEDDTYYYGKAIEATKTLAIKAAINDAITNLHIGNVDTILTIDEDFKDFYLKNLLANKIKPNIYEVYINNYEIVHEKENFSDYSAMIRIDKKVFIEGLKKQLELYQNIYKEAIKLYKDKTILEQYSLLDKINIETKDMYYITNIIYEIDKSFEKSETTQFISFIENSLNSKKNELKFSIQTNDKTKKIDNMFIDKLKKENFNIVKKGESNFIIEIDYIEDVSNFINGKHLTLICDIRIIFHSGIIGDENNKVLSGNKIILKEKFLKNYEETLEVILNKLKKSLDEKTFQKVFNLK